MAHPDPTTLVVAGWRYALSLTGDSVRADDLVQEAWASVLKARGPLERAYLFRAIRSRWIDAWRRRREEPDLPAEVVCIAPRIDARVEAKQEMALALSTLRPEEREVLHLCVVEGYTASEAASLVGKPRNTVLSLLHRGRAKLRAAITPLGREVMP